MKKVENFYNRNFQREWDRLERHRTEFAVTMQAFEDYLPKPDAAILDVGGGPGRYAIALARMGYQVTLLDLSQENLNMALKKAYDAGVKLSGYIPGDARDLKCLTSESFDAALILGPFYHIHCQNDREKVLSEVNRILKPKGIVAAAFIIRNAVIRDTAKYDPIRIIEDGEILEEVLNTGILKMPEDSDDFTDAYFSLPSEIIPFMKWGGFETLTMVACEGVISLIEEKVNELEGEVWKKWVKLNYRLGQDPSVFGSAEHILYMGKKKVKKVKH